MAGSRAVVRGAGQAPDFTGMNVTNGDPRTLLAVLAGDSVLCTGLGWQNHATCAGIGQEMFYPPKGDAPEAVPAVCRTACPVRRECLTDALEHSGLHEPGTHGYWGGTSPNERQALLRQFRGNVTVAVDFALAAQPREKAA